MSLPPGILARGRGRSTRTRDLARGPVRSAAERIAAADAAIAALRERGSRSTTGSARGSSPNEHDDGVLKLELQPVRWALRRGGRRVELDGGALRHARGGRALARRAARAWLSTWPGRWRSAPRLGRRRRVARADARP